MVVVTILGVLAAVATPSMNRLMAAQRVRSMTTDLHLALVKARSEAIKRNVAVTLAPAGGDWNAGWVVSDPANPGGPPLQVFSPAAGVRIVASVPQVVYAGSGRTTLVAEASFVLDSARTDLARCVLVNLAGRPYVKEGATC